ncbi:hypothetical protein [Erythrobacter sp. R86502]|uniref:hypothetical protein n=1 Tax=Erythrobacter sp. R86502 TaxID=3093846 RepID=UPI0036D27AA0
MRITITKGAAHDHVAVDRADGTRDAFAVPRKGPYPHDAYHFFVERELGLAGGFWGLVAAGLAPDAVQALALAGGHASAKRAAIPDTAIIELLQAERLVECFEAASWGGGADDAAIMAMAEPAWAASHVPRPDGVLTRLGTIRSGLDAFLARWRVIDEGASIVLDWPGMTSEAA